MEFTRNRKLYRCYTGKKRVNAYGDIPWETPDYVEDFLTGGTYAYYGPGLNYAKRRNSVYKNTTVRVFAVEGDWAHCEYKEGNKWCRAYIPVDKLTNTVARATPVPTATPTPTAASISRTNYRAHSCKNDLLMNQSAEELITRNMNQWLP